MILHNTWKYTINTINDITQCTFFYPKFSWSFNLFIVTDLYFIQTFVTKIPISLSLNINLCTRDKLPNFHIRIIEWRENWVNIVDSQTVIESFSIQLFSFFVSNLRGTSRSLTSPFCTSGYIFLYKIHYVIPNQLKQNIFYTS